MDLYSAKSNQPIQKLDRKLITKGESKVGSFGMRFKQIYTLYCRMDDEDGGRMYLVDNMIELIHTITWQPFTVENKQISWRNSQYDDLTVILLKTINYYGRLSSNDFDTSDEARYGIFDRKSNQKSGWVLYMGYDLAITDAFKDYYLDFDLLGHITTPGDMTALSNNYCPRHRYIPYMSLFAWDLFFAAAMNAKEDSKISFSAPGLKLQVGKKIWGWMKFNRNGGNRANGNNNDQGNNNNGLFEGGGLELVPERIDEWNNGNMSPRERARSMDVMQRIVRNFDFAHKNPDENRDENRDDDGDGHKCDQVWLGNSRLGFYFVNGFGNLDLSAFGTANKK